MNDLEQYLASEAAQGLMIDEGGFSLTPEKALEKLSLFSLPSPGMWVLKLLQAAVAVGAPEIRFSFQRQLVQVEFDNLGGWDAQLVLDQLLSAQTSDRPAIRHVVTGLLGAAMGFSQYLAWSCGESAVRVQKSGPTSEPQTDDGLFRLVATRPKQSALSINTFSSPIGYLMRQTAHEYKALVDYGVASPIPIIIDKFRLEGSYQMATSELPKVKGYDSEGSDGTGVMLGQLPISGLDRPPIVYPIDHAPLENFDDEREKLGTLRLAPAPGVEVQAVVCVHACLQRCSRVNLMMDGVLLESRLLTDDPLAGPLLAALADSKDDLVLDVYLNVGWKELDITQFKSRENSFLRELAAGVPQLRALLQTLSQEAPKKWDFSKTPPVVRKLPSLTIGSIVGGAFLTMFIPHFIILGGFCGVAYVGAKAINTLTPVGTLWEKMADKMHQTKAKQFQERLARTLASLEGMEQRLLSPH